MSRGITEIAAELGVHKSTASRLVSVLEGRGLVEQLGQRGKYVIGFGVVRLAGAAIGRLDLASVGLPVCQGLADPLGETINIAVLDGAVAVNITQARGAAAISAQNWIGQRTPLHATSSGKVLLAHLEPARRKEIVNGPLPALHPNTLTDPAALADDSTRCPPPVTRPRSRNWRSACTRSPCPIFGAGGRRLAAISAVRPRVPVAASADQAIAADLVAAAARPGRSAQLLALTTS